MSKLISRNAKPGRFVIGRAAAQQFNAVEGIRPSGRTSKILAEARRDGQSGDALRSRIRAEFTRKP